MTTELLYLYKDSDKNGKFHTAKIMQCQGEKQIHLTHDTNNVRSMGH